MEKKKEKARAWGHRAEGTLESGESR